jgi:HAD superfamily phosphatase (TIGR01668 family)
MGLMRLRPDAWRRRIEEVSLADLRARGIRGIALDLDNTITGWNGTEIPDPIAAWLRAARESGMRLCIVSNTSRPARVARVAEAIGAQWVARAAKPSRRAFRQAMRQMGTKPGETAVIGDQVFTDIWGGNRAGLYTILVEPLTERDFPMTKLSRVAERFLLARWRQG